jgi:hypothetical protein
MTTAAGPALGTQREGLKPTLTPQTANLALTDDATAARPGMPCFQKVLKVYPSRPVAVGAAYSDFQPHVSLSFTYLAGQSSKLGVLAEIPGTNSFKAGGTHSWSSTSKQDFGHHSTNQLYRTDFEYKKFSNTCLGVFARVAGYDGGDRTEGGVAAFKVNTSLCQPERASDTFSKFDTTATTFSAGVSLAKTDLGVNASADTGYTKTSQVNFKFGMAGRICGRSGQPGQSPGRLIAISPPA